MGLKTTNYEVKDLGINLPTAYARLTNVNVSLSGRVSAVFEIHQIREDIDDKKPIESKHINCKIDKDLPLHRQIYEIAKENLFVDWEDDIID